MLTDEDTARSNATKFFSPSGKKGQLFPGTLANFSPDVAYHLSKAVDAVYAV
jgi:hypothetical protein